ncbi:MULTISPECIES: hypothetical protein [Aeribacillus]|jgi:RNA-directed DNA polymerase|uniref:hypothetical protein n=1 Tax=Aeribacillus TaxID=1055323 RepID=UPI001F5D6E84|nr:MULTISPECIES: hypothetical protein [Aeribacillus]MED0703821.1 hypothetical protein [Aeribacillus composti]
MEDGQFHNTEKGNPAGRSHFVSFSEQLPALYGHDMKEEVPTLRRTVRYADDFVIMCRTKNEALENIQVLKAIMKKLDLEINTEIQTGQPMGRHKRI